MKLFLDSVNLQEIKKYSMYGIVDGVTTNPSLMASSGLGFHEVASNICQAVAGDVSLEVLSNDYEDMLDEGEKIMNIAGNVVIKLPSTWDGLKACKYFADRGIKVNMTLCFSVHQALLAAKAGATYVSPFIGRLEDNGEDGIGLIADIREIYDNYNITTNILAASIRNLDHVADAAICGADAITIPAGIMSSLLDNKLTDAGLKKFNQDWAKSGMKI